MTEPAYPGLQDDLARSRETVAPAPVTIATCRRVVAMLKDASVVDRATVIRCLEFLLAGRS